MMEAKPKSQEEPVAVVYDFKCSLCTTTEKAHYKGTKPPFSRNIELKYPSYVMKDPFSPPGKGEILVLGADCGICDKTVCVHRYCSLFYGKLYCLNCVHQNIQQFPDEIKSKVSQIKK